jgi:hypothetical protein
MIIAKHLFKPYLEDGEKIIHAFHRHPVVLVPDVVRISFFGFAIPIFLWYLWPNLWLCWLIWICVSWIRLVYAIFKWYHDSILITDASLLHVDWNGFFDRSSSRLDYHLITGTSSQIKGVLRTILNYGTVTIGATGSGMTLPDAVNPKNVEKLVVIYQEKFISHQNVKDNDALKSLLVQLVRHHAKTGDISLDK